MTFQSNEMSSQTNQMHSQSNEMDPILNQMVAFNMLQGLARWNTVPFKRFDDLEVGRWYQIDKFLLTNGQFGIKLAARIKNTAEFGGLFVINLPDRFKVMAKPEVLEELNVAADKGYMYYGGKDAFRKNRIILDFSKEQFHQSAENGVNESVDVPY